MRIHIRKYIEIQIKNHMRTNEKHMKCIIKSREIQNIGCMFVAIGPMAHPKVTSKCEIGRWIEPQIALGNPY